MSASLFVDAVSVGIPLLWLAILIVFRRQLIRLWYEPVLHYPVLIIESDDWGPGPAEHVSALAHICKILEGHKDVRGHPAVMTIGVILAVADNASIRTNGFTRYARKTLKDKEYVSLCRLLHKGNDSGVLALQLHGLEHLWAPALMRAGNAAGEVRNWIETATGSDTELLPSPIQSRWIDGSVLPSKVLSANEIDTAVNEEVDLYRECFGDGPAVVVPPTFIWNEAVERAWARNGVDTVITPGRRYTGRDAQGAPCCVDRQILNGDISSSNMIYLVRDIYFEPAIGHKAEDVLTRIQEYSRLGRPALLETHRFNFIGHEQKQKESLAELDRLLSFAQKNLPSLRFVSSEELAMQFRTGAGELLEKRLPARMEAWINRATQIGRLRKLAWATGLVFPAFLIQLALKGLSPNNEPANKGNPA